MRAWGAWGCECRQPCCCSGCCQASTCARLWNLHQSSASPRSARPRTGKCVGRQSLWVWNLKMEGQHLLLWNAGEIRGKKGKLMVKTSSLLHGCCCPGRPLPGKAVSPLSPTIPLIPQRTGSSVWACELAVLSVLPPAVWSWDLPLTPGLWQQTVCSLVRPHGQSRREVLVSIFSALRLCSTKAS